MLILLFGIIFHILSGIYATNTTNLHYCEIQKQEFCGSRPHLLCESKPKNVNNKLDEPVEKPNLMEQLNLGRDNASLIHWDDELELMSLQYSTNDNPNRYCMSSRNFLDVQIVLFKMKCYAFTFFCNLTSNPFEEYAGNSYNIGCCREMTQVHDFKFLEHFLVCLYNSSNRMTSNLVTVPPAPKIQDLNLNATMNDGILNFNMFAVWLILAPVGYAMTTI